MADSAADVGGRIRRLRQQRGLSQEDLAGPDLSPSYLSRIESGARRATDRVLADLADRLGTTVEHLQTGVDPSATEAWELRVRYAELALRSGEWAEATERFRSLVTSADVVPPVRARAELGLAQSFEASGDLEAALAHFDVVVDAAIAGSKTWIDASLGLIRCYRQVGDVHRSVDVGQQALGTLRAAPDWPTPDGIRVLATLQASYQIRGDYRYAKRLAAEAVRLAEQLDDRRALASALWNTSLLNAELGSTADAVATAERALALLSELDAERDLVRLRIALARLHTLDGHPDQALTALDAVQLRREGLAIAAENAYARTERARALVAIGSFDAAANEANAALAALGDAPRTQSADLFLILAAAARGKTDPTGEAEYLRRAAQALTAGANDRTTAQSWLELGNHLDALGDLTGARDAYLAAAINLGLHAPSAPATALRSRQTTAADPQVRAR